MLESIVEELLTRKSNLCPIGEWINDLDAADQERMAQLLSHEDVSASELVRVLRPYRKFSESSMRRHRAHVAGRVDILNLCSCA